MPLGRWDVLHLQSQLPASVSRGKHIFAKNSERKHKAARHLRHELAGCAVFSIPPAPIHSAGTASGKVMLPNWQDYGSSYTSRRAGPYLNLQARWGRSTTSEKHTASRPLEEASDIGEPRLFRRPQKQPSPHPILLCPSFRLSSAACNSTTSSKDGTVHQPPFPLHQRNGQPEDRL